jgi:hypothetical protein
MTGMNVTARITRLIPTLALLLTGLTSSAAESVVTPAVVGHWEGNARIVNSWCQQTNLAVKLDIHGDGSVTGTVGDAKITTARFQRNRGWVGRKLNLWSDYIISGDLEGAIVAAEGITRKRVMMPLNFSNGSFNGGLNSSGSKFSGKDGMILSAMSLTLSRSE